MSEDNQQRRPARFAAGISAIAHLRGRDYPCEAHNLNRTGVLLIGEIPRPDEPEIETTLRSAGGDLQIRVRGRVAHVSEATETGSIKIGLAFEAVDEATLEALERLVSRVVEGRAPAPLAELASGAPPSEVLAALEKIQLPHRIALAGRALPRERAFLMMDPRPQVLEALARNTGLTLSEAKVLARLSQLLPSTVAVMAEDPRWERDKELRLMLICHPRVQLHVAEKMVSAMNEMEQRKVMQKPGINPVLREKLSRKFRNRRLTNW